jgi:two-component system OmpR family sensor kinase
VRGPLSLRTRLILGVISLAAIGLLAADLATYSSLRSFLVARTDSALDDAHRAVELALENGPSEHGPAGGGGNGPAEPASAELGPLTSAVRGDYVQVRRLNGSIVLGGLAAQFPGGEQPSPPQLPKTVALPRRTEPAGDRTTYFTAPAKKGGGRYRVRAWTDAGAPGYVFLLAAPLTSVDSTLHRLMGIEVLVTALVLAAMALLGLWVVRLGLRPLAAIGDTAAKIADGDLSQRVERADGRTEIGRLGLSLNAMLAQIEAGYKAREQSERKLRRFVADASHELRTPLAAVRAYAELFHRGAVDRPEDLERSMTGIGRESERMSLLVEDLLLLARLDEGRPLEREEVRLDELVADAIDAAQAVEPDRPIDARLDDAVVLGDGDRLRQAVDNLLANVRAHTPDGTAAHVRVESSNGTATISVADDGPGLDPEQA